MRGRVGLQLIGALLALGAARCASPSLTDRCINDSDCNAGRACTLGRCGAPPADAFGMPEVPANVAAACADWANATCEKEKGCTSPAHYGSLYADDGACARLDEYGCREALTEPGFMESASGRQQCARELAQQSCDDWLQFSLESCYAPGGSLPDQAACHADDQCRLYSICSREPEDYCGTCQAIAFAEDGESCAEGNTECGFDSECSGGVCVPLVPVDEACDAAAPHCAGSAICSDGYCVQAVGYPGFSCIDSASCNDALGQCNAATGTCAESTAASVGEPCAVLPASGLQPACVAGTSCVTSASGGRCEPDLALGAACEPAAGAAVCKAPAHCIDHHCALVSPSFCR